MQRVHAEKFGEKALNRGQNRAEAECVEPRTFHTLATALLALLLAKPIICSLAVFGSHVINCQQC